MRVLGLERVVTGLAFAWLGAACSSGSSAPVDSAAQAVTSTTARLEGTWTLLEFRPVEALEPMLASLLAAQMSQLTVSFHAGSMHVEGVGLSTTREIRVTQAAVDGFAATIVDPTNVSYEVTGAFQGNDLAFTSKTDPWRGQGRLRRAH